MRNSKGQFEKGNKGKPKGAKSRMTILRNIIQESTKEEELISIKNELHKKAMSGDVSAAKLFLEYTIGKPVQVNHEHLYDHTESSSINFNNLIQAIKTGEV